MNESISEDIQRRAARLIATSPAGLGLSLIGGFRYRILDHSSRRSVDLDYHWEGDPEAKQAELADLLQRRLLPELKQALGLNGDVRVAGGLQVDSPFVKTVELAVYGPGVQGRLEIPLDIVRIPCADKPIARTVDGVVYLSISDADMAEAKVLAVLSRTWVAERDLVDLFLFQSALRPDSVRRLAAKFPALALTPPAIAHRLAQLQQDRTLHLQRINQVLQDLMEPAVVGNLDMAGGPAMLFDHVLALLNQLCAPA